MGKYGKKEKKKKQWLDKKRGSPPETTRAGSYKRFLESLKDFSEKLARAG